MPKNENFLQVAREWIAKAENDLRNAAHALKLRKKCPTDTVCFHAQQCVEKYLKAILILNGVDFPKTHDIVVIVSLLPRKLRPDLSAEYSILRGSAGGGPGPSGASNGQKAAAESGASCIRSSLCLLRQ